MQILQQVEDLRLHRDIQRAGGFVADYKFGVHCQCTCNTDTLALTAGELVWIVVYVFGPQSNLTQQFLCALPALLCIGADPLGDHALFNNVHDTHAWIHGGVRVLEYDLEIRAPAAQRLPLESGQFDRFKTHAAGGRFQQLQDTLADRCFAAAGFANQRQGLPLGDRQADTVHRAHLADDPFKQALVNGEMDFQFIDFKQRVVWRPTGADDWYCRFIPGRPARRRRKRGVCQVTTHTPL